MRRRSFIRNLANIPLLAYGYRSPADYPKEPGYSFEVTDNSIFAGTGISSIDRFSSAFQGGNVISIFGIDESIVGAFLVHSLLYQGLIQHKTVDFVSIDGTLEKHHEKLSRFLGKPDEATVRTFFSDSENRQRFRVHEIDPGDPSNSGWRDYVKKTVVNPPDSIIIDDIVNIEYFLQERGLAKQLRELALKTGAPVFVNVPLKDEPGSSGRTSKRARRFFENSSDVCISLHPSVATPYVDGENNLGTLYEVNVNMFSNFQSLHNDRSFSCSFSISYLDYCLTFRSI